MLGEQNRFQGVAAGPAVGLGQVDPEQSRALDLFIDRPGEFLGEVVVFARRLYLLPADAVREGDDLFLLFRQVVVHA